MQLDTKKIVTLENIVSLCKRRGFVYQSADIYGGLNGVYDFGHLGTIMKRNIRSLWLKSIQNNKGDIVELEGALLSPESVWKASGHVDNFHDPMVDCRSCKSRFRADDLDLSKGCQRCGKNDWTDVRTFNMMFKTNLGALETMASVSYLRPETAQAIFVNFKNVFSTARVKIPFGIAQIGKSFRNEITPKQFLFRMREFEQMEIEWFCHPDNALVDFNFWVSYRMKFYELIGLNLNKIRIREHHANELAHYSTRCLDIEYEFPFGWKELEGIAYRGNFDLTQHSVHSGKDLNVFDDELKQSYIPHVVESSIGTDRLFLTLLFDAYDEDIIDGESRIVLRLPYQVAPIKIAFLSLTKKQDSALEKIYFYFKSLGASVVFDNSGSIGKRYRRYDEIGVPFCVTYDFDSDIDNSVTIRNRDTTQQIRMSIAGLFDYFTENKII